MSAQQTSRACLFCAGTAESFYASSLPKFCEQVSPSQKAIRLPLAQHKAMFSGFRPQKLRTQAFSGILTPANAKQTFGEDASGFEQKAIPLQHSEKTTAPSKMQTCQNLRNRNVTRRDCQNRMHGGRIQGSRLPRKDFSQIHTPENKVCSSSKLAHANDCEEWPSTCPLQIICAEFPEAFGSNLGSMNAPIHAVFGIRGAFMDPRWVSKITRSLGSWILDLKADLEVEFVFRRMGVPKELLEEGRIRIRFRILYVCHILIYIYMHICACAYKQKDMHAGLTSH